MRKAGSPVFAVMAYVISHMQPDKAREEFIHLNPEVLHDAIGDPVEVMQGAIDYLCAPDAKTTTPGEDGRRLVKKTPYVYWVVNGKHYRRMMDEEDRRMKAAERQAKCRSEKKESAATVTLTGKEAEEYEAARGKSLRKRSKVIETAGVRAGATEAIHNGLAAAMAAPTPTPHESTPLPDLEDGII